MQNNFEPLNQSDLIDQGSQCAQFFTDLAIKAVLDCAVKVSLDNESKECLNCGQYSEGRFCDIECRNEYQEYESKNKVLEKFNGK